MDQAIIWVLDMLAHTFPKLLCGAALCSTWCFPEACVFCRLSGDSAHFPISAETYWPSSINLSINWLCYQTGHRVVLSSSNLFSLSLYVYSHSTFDESICLLFILSSTLLGHNVFRDCMQCSVVFCCWWWLTAAITPSAYLFDTHWDPLCMY